MPNPPAEASLELPADERRIVVRYLLGEAGLPVAEDEVDELVSVFELVRGMTPILYGDASARLLA